MGGQAPLRIAPDVDAFHRDAREAPLVLADVVDGVEGDVALERHRARRQLLVLHPDLAADLLLRHARQLTDPLEQPRSALPIARQLGRLELQLERGPVLNQRAPGPVEDLAARGLNGELPHLVVLRLGEVVVAGEHPEVPEPQEDDREHDQRDSAEHGDPEGELRRDGRPAPVAAARHHGAPPATGRRRAGRRRRRRTGPEPWPSLAADRDRPPRRRRRPERRRPGTSSRRDGA